MAGCHNKKKYRNTKILELCLSTRRVTLSSSFIGLEVSSLGLGISFLGLGSSSFGFGIGTFGREGNFFIFGFWQGFSLLILALILRLRPPLTSLLATNYLRWRERGLSGRGLFQRGKGKNSRRRQHSWSLSDIL